ncbi:MAG: WD40 repeat domain-containing protein [Thainema sp.]
MTFSAIAQMNHVPHDRPPFLSTSLRHPPGRDDRDPAAHSHSALNPSWRCTHTIAAHHAWVRCVAISPDSQWIASASGDRTIKIWSAKTGELIRTLRWHAGWVRGVAFSPDGRTVASVSSDRTLRLWDTRTGELRRTWQAHAAWVGTVAFSPDGQLIATGSQDCLIKIWSVQSPSTEPAQVLSGHTHWIRTLTFSVDGRYLASGSRDRTVRIWQVTTGASSQPIEAHNGEVWSVAFDPHHCDRIASSGADGVAKLWKWTIGDQLGAFTPPATARSADDSQSQSSTNRPTDDSAQPSTRALTTLAFHPSQPVLATAGQDKTICLWHSTTGKLLAALDEHRSWIWSVDFSCNGQLLVSGDWEGLVKIWQLS